MSFLRCASIGLPLGLLLGCSIDTGNVFGEDGSGATSQGGTVSDGGRNEGGGRGGADEGGHPMTGGQTSDGGSMASGPMCGDGVKNGTEECDGADLGGLDCTSFGSDNPDGLSCTGECLVDKSGCEEPNDCGDGTTQAGEDCDDGNLAGNDGCSATCKTEGTCATAIEVSLGGTPISLLGDTTNAGTDDTSGNAGNCTKSFGPEIVFRVTAEHSGILTAYLPAASTFFDSVLYARSTCAQADDSICNDNFGTPSDDGGEVLSFPVEENQSVLIFVDGYESDELGPFELRLDLSKGDNCTDPVPIIVEGDGALSLLGNTTGYTSDANANALCFGAGNGPDIVYDMSITEGGDYTFSLDATFDSVVYARNACTNNASQLGCSAPGTSEDSEMTVGVDGSERVIVWVDGTSGEFGSYELRVAH